jgi:hypothetical protein
MAVAGALIGSRISVISHRDVRYEGTLFSVNVDDASVVIQNGERTPQHSYAGPVDRTHDRATAIR